MYVVTGASGNTGGVVAERLLEAGKKVCAISRSAGRLRHLERRGAKVFEAQLTDAEALTDALQGAEGVYLMVPPEMSRDDYPDFQRAVINSYASALENSHVKYAVALSSVGADKGKGCGPVDGLHELEQRLEGIAGLSVLFLRPGYFMENLLPQAELIHQLGMCVGPLHPELKLPMIATRDIGAVAAEALVLKNFEPGQRLELQGQRDVSMREASAVLGEAIGKPDLKYAQAPEEQVRPALRKTGMSDNSAGLILELASALNSGHMHALEPRNAQNSTPTTLEIFVRQEFLPRYQQGIAA